MQVWCLHLGPPARTWSMSWAKSRRQLFRIRRSCTTFAWRFLHRKSGQQLASDRPGLKRIWLDCQLVFNFLNPGESSLTNGTIPLYVPLHAAGSVFFLFLFYFHFICLSLRWLLLWLQEQAAVLLWNMDGYQTEIVSTFFLLAHGCHAAMDAPKKVSAQKARAGAWFPGRKVKR